MVVESSAQAIVPLRYIRLKGLRSPNPFQENPDCTRF